MQLSFYLKVFWGNLFSTSLKPFSAVSLFFRQRSFKAIFNQRSFKEVENWLLKKRKKEGGKMVLVEKWFLSI